MIQTYPMNAHPVVAACQKTAILQFAIIHDFPAKINCSEIDINGSLININSPPNAKIPLGEQVYFTSGRLSMIRFLQFLIVKSDRFP